MKVKRIGFHNDLGGSETLEGSFEVIVDRWWEDDEIGARYLGRLVNAEDIERVRQAMITPFEPKKKFATGERFQVNWGQSDWER